MDRRKEELEKKKQKLAELRRAREERKAVTSVGLASAQGAAGAGEDLDDLVSSLVGERRVDASPPQVPGAVTSSATTVAERTSSEPSAAAADQVPQQQTTEPEKYTPTLESVDFMIYEMAPRERVFYNKEAQTTTTSLDVEEVAAEDISKNAAVDAEVPDVDTAAKEGTATAQKEEDTPKPKEFNEDEKKMIFQSEHFLTFFDHSSKLIERALNEKYDILRDYTISDDAPIDADAGKGVKLYCSFFDERWSKNRSVTDVSWSPKYAELLLCSYNKNQIAINEADGLVLLWSLHLPERPEFVFQTQSDVMTAKFSEFHPNLIIGGTYSGQIVLWDTRSKSLPVLKTPLSAAGHTHPVYSMAVVGTQNAHNIVSASTDGLVCSWTLDMLAQPQRNKEMLDLLNPAHAKTDEISVTTMAFPANETATFWVGTEEGSIYQANRYDRAGSKAGVNPFDAYKGHFGMVTGMHFHPQVGPVDFSDLFVTSSVDWTVKIWRSKSLSKASVTPQQISPLYSFEEADDYVYDVKWSPVHPAMFGSVDGSGRFDVYDLNQDTEVPIASVNVGNNKALNKLDWDKEGKKCAIGASDGQCHVYDLGEMSQPTSESWSSFHQILSEKNA
ncbi:hypothetical protein HK101_009615 [Irineochytrium annulatum]|nr:hypothetical protein HK101_009615 [Irineochytrium annulatum]